MCVLLFRNTVRLYFSIYIIGVCGVKLDKRELKIGLTYAALLATCFMAYYCTLQTEAIGFYDRLAFNILKM
jgi:hypothetical protein